MQLSEWLETNGIRASEFAARIGVSPQTITGWCDGSFWVSKKRAQAIFDATDGQVTPTDLMQTVKAEAAQ